MPLNDYPTAKPTYDFSDTVTAGRTVVANGELVSVQHHGASREFPRGSVTWNWHAGMPVASYLVEDSVGNFSFDEEMEGMIAFSGGVIDTDTLYHENMHQWWGDNVSEGGYHMTFFG